MSPSCQSSVPSSWTSSPSSTVISERADTRELPSARLYRLFFPDICRIRNPTAPTETSTTAASSADTAAFRTLTPLSCSRNVSALLSAVYSYILRQYPVCPTQSSIHLPDCPIPFHFPLPNYTIRRTFSYSKNKTSPKAGFMFHSARKKLVSLQSFELLKIDFHTKNFPFRTMRLPLMLLTTP